MQRSSNYTVACFPHLSLLFKSLFSKYAILLSPNHQAPVVSVCIVEALLATTLVGDQFIAL